MPAMRRALVAAVVLIAALVTLLPASAGPHTPASAPRRIVLPAPQRDVDPLAGIGLARDRLLTSVVPGRVVTHEAVTVSVGASGAPAAVVDVQQLRLEGTGGYVVRERGPARDAVGLAGTVPPVLELGTVVWQGFSPGGRTLAARLTLDPGLEAERLPLSVGLSFRSAAGRVTPLAPGLVAPTGGTVTVTLTNRSGAVRELPVGTAAPAPLAAALDRLRSAASHPRSGHAPPTAGAGAPASLPGRTVGATAQTVIAPLLVTGSVTVAGGSAAASGAGVTPTADGGTIDGVLDGSTSLRVPVTAGHRVSLRLMVQPGLDPRTLVPPAPASSWRQWARRAPSRAAVTAATTTLVAAAAAAARSAEFTPYLQADVPGPDLATFSYVSAPVPRRAAAAVVLSPRPVAISVTVVAALAIVTNLLLLRRRL